MCDRCDDYADTFEDEYDADRWMREQGWYTSVEIDNYSYDHICNGCAENIDTCEWCEELFDHSDNCYCCDVTLCSEYCQEQHHNDMWDTDSREAECLECGLENPLYAVLGSQPTTALSWQI